MVCKHCQNKIIRKKGQWLEVLTPSTNARLRKWHAERIDEFRAKCIRSVSYPPEIGTHEPTKESIVYKILKKYGTKLQE